MEKTLVEHYKEIYEKLSAPMPEEAVERSKGAETGKGYNTTGYGYQYCVNRFNDVLGLLGWSFTYEEVDRLDGTDKSGRPRISVTIDCTIEIAEGIKKTCSGGHISNNYADARKGAITNAFKKTAALFGVGKAAYEGTIDDDNQPIKDGGSYEVVRPQRTTISAPDVMASSPEQLTGYAAKLAANTPFQGCNQCGGPLSTKLGKNGKPYCARFCFDDKNKHLQDAWRQAQNAEKMDAIDHSNSPVGDRHNMATVEEESIMNGDIPF